MNRDHRPSKENPAKLILIGILVTFVCVAIVGVTLLYPHSGWSGSAMAKSLKNPFPSTPESIADAKNDFTAHCQSCHGANGNGRGERAEKLSIAPADFGDTHAMGLQTDGELFWVITEGHKPMPAFRGTMSDEQRWHLVDYVRGFAHN
jgi:mono/diheme cytochrome c family protein